MEETQQVRTVEMAVSVPADWTETQVIELVRQFTQISRPQGVEIYSHRFMPEWGKG